MQRELATVKRKRRVPDWVPYIYGPRPDYRDRYLADKLLDDASWSNWQQACYRAVKACAVAKASGKDTPPRARELPLREKWACLA